MCLLLGVFVPHRFEKRFFVLAKRDPPKINSMKNSELTENSSPAAGAQHRAGGAVIRARRAAGGDREGSTPMEWALGEHARVFFRSEVG